MDLKQEHAVYLFINNHLLTGHKTLGELYPTLKEEDNFMYVTITREATFG